MSCNFYARILPTEQEKKELKEYIDNNAFSDINFLTQKLYGNRELGNPEGRLIHLGKKSYRWKFLWDHNVLRLADGYMDENNKYVLQWKYDKVYDLNIESIRKFLSRSDVIIVDENYQENEPIDGVPVEERGIYTVDEFMEIATNPDGWTSKTYREETGRKDSDIYLTDEQRDIIRHLDVDYDSQYSDFTTKDGLRFFFCTDFG